MKISRNDLEAIAKAYDPEAWEEEWSSNWRAFKDRDATNDRLKELWKRDARSRRDRARAKIKEWYLIIDRAGFAITPKGN